VDLLYIFKEVGSLFLYTKNFGPLKVTAVPPKLLASIILSDIHYKIEPRLIIHNEAIASVLYVSVLPTEKHSIIPRNMPEAQSNPDAGQVAWVCTLCGLNSRQKAETSYIKHLEDLHYDQLDEQKASNSGGFKQWRESLINAAFKLSKYVEKAISGTNTRN
jgi:hypothetical protein